MKEKLLGFDIREQWLAIDELWRAHRRARYLLRDDVRKPLSTDTLVWPSVFDTGQGHAFPAEIRGQLQSGNIPAPDWIGPNAGIWDDLGGMRWTFSSFIAGRQTADRTCAMVAITWLSGQFQPGDAGPYAEPTVPAVRAPEWQLLGYDVSDGSLLSGLTNCGYLEEEKEELSGIWSPHLNTHHLFIEPDAAFRFREVTDQRVREHAPFFVFGVYSIENSEC